LVAASDLSLRNILKGTNLTNANLAGAKFMLADMTNAHIDGANLTDADLDGAIIDGITEAGTHYCRTKWSDGNFRSRIGLEDATASGGSLSGPKVVGSVTEAVAM
jgi:uncharacterized protein YjbI with pentapeptide repeats